MDGQDTSELKRKLRSWRDKHTTKIDADLRAAWPALEGRLKATVEDDPLALIRKKRRKTFLATKLQPEIEAWVKRRAEPLMMEASQGLSDICESVMGGAEIKPGEIDNAGPGLAGPVMSAIGPILAGLGAAIAGVMLGIGAFLGIFVTISWPILIGGLVVGGSLAAFGVGNGMKLKEKISRRFCNAFIPKIKDALVGSGYKQDGKHHPSLREQLMDQIAEAAKQAEIQVAQLRGDA